METKIKYKEFEELNSNFKILYFYRIFNLTQTVQNKFGETEEKDFVFFPKDLLN